LEVHPTCIDQNYERLNGANSIDRYPRNSNILAPANLRAADKCTHLGPHSGKMETSDPGGCELSVQYRVSQQPGSNNGITGLPKLMTRIPIQWKFKRLAGY